MKDAVDFNQACSHGYAVFFWLHAREQVHLGAEVQGDLSVRVVGNTFLLTKRQMLFFVGL
jgi:hypothetical protein